MNKTWRDDGLSYSGGSPTMYAWVVKATDECDRMGIFKLEIMHILAHQGKGFAPIVTSQGSGATGNFHASYDDAVTEGRAILQRRYEENEKEFLQFKNFLDILKI